MQLENARRAKYKAAVQSGILEAARAIFIKEGYEGFSMRILADRIGYSAAAAYRHFKSKGEIFQRLADESFAALMQASVNVKHRRDHRGVGYQRSGIRRDEDRSIREGQRYTLRKRVGQPPARAGH